MSQPPIPPRYAVPAAMLNYAPLGKDRNRGAWVIVGGLVTTALALAGVWALEVFEKTEVMGWYANYCIPWGAILLGMAASSGYALMSWKLGVRVRGRLLATVAILLFVSYFAAQYVEFLSQGPLLVQVNSTVNTPQGPQTVTQYQPLGFWENFHLTAVNWTWESNNAEDVIPDLQHPGQLKYRNQPLGMLGYVFVILGIVGYCMSGFGLMAMMLAMPYCDLCERYMARRLLLKFPASVPSKGRRGMGLFKSSAPSSSLQEEALHEAESRRRQITVAAGQSGQALLIAIQPPPGNAKLVKKVSRTLHVDLTYCPGCNAGQLAFSYVAGEGRSRSVTQVSKIEVAPDILWVVVASVKKPRRQAIAPSAG